MYRRYVEQYTVAIISYTKDGIRHKEEKVKILNIDTYNKFELYNEIKKRYTKIEKPYVHEIVSAYYWEE